MSMSMPAHRSEKCRDGCLAVAFDAGGPCATNCAALVTAALVTPYDRGRAEGVALALRVLRETCGICNGFGRADFGADLERCRHCGPMRTRILVAARAAGVEVPDAE
jgi:hypothetical protein